jgi:hypothetical protein
MPKQKFSDRLGITKHNPIQIDSMNGNLRNSLWNLILNSVFSGDSERFRGRVEFIFNHFLKIPEDDLPYADTRKILKQIFFYDDFYWWKVYNLIEFIAENTGRTTGNSNPDKFIAKANMIFEEETAGYRFLNGVIVPITNPAEIESIDESIDSANRNRLYGTETHLKTAIELLSKKPIPDYRNSIKESISAIESLVKQLVGDEGGGLDKALEKLDAKVKFHGAFKAGLLSLYGSTSDEDGIRHAILEEPNLGFDEAKFMLVACSTLVNFIIAKATKSGLISGSPE